MFTSCDLANMRTAQVDHMQEVCLIQEYTAGTANEYNEQDAPIYTTRLISICGLDMRAGSERHGTNVTAINYDATLRLPISALVTETDRVEMIGRYSEYPIPLVFEIVSPIQRGPSGIRVMLRKIVT
jgi:hypothetical protein